VQEKPISDLLALADQHKLASVIVTRDDLNAVSTDGQHYHALKEDGQVVTDLLRQDGVMVQVTNDSGAAWEQTGFDLLFLGAAAGLLLFIVFRSGLGGTFTRTRARRYRESKPPVLFCDVAGVEEAKQDLTEIVEFLHQPERFAAMGARIPRGALLVGEPGTGKTLISRAVAGEAGVPFYSINGSEFVEMFVGVGAARVRDLFKEARKNAPCVVFIDEIDAVGRARTNNTSSGNDEREQTLNQLLVEMDGFDQQTSIVVLAATNRPDVLDPALLRPGRFDRRVLLDKPDLRGREAILAVHARAKPLATDITLTTIARQTVGFTGADLANMLNEAALLAARNHRETIIRHDLEEAIMRVVAGPERKSRLLSETERTIIAYHEVGHAIVMRSLPGSDPVQKVTAIARGGALGITVQAPLEDRYLLRRSELQAKMAGMMGGRAAEELIFGDITTGASQDFAQATSLARRMVCEFGMSALGTLALNSAIDDSSYSPETAARVDQEISSLVAQAYQTALDILRTRHDRLVQIAEHLLQVETLDGSELDTLLDVH
jgi:cell division protease FtsH